MRKKQRPSILGILSTLISLILLLGVIGCSDDDDDDGIITPEKKGVLTDWKGDWDSHAAHLDSAEAKAGYAVMAKEKPGYAAEDIEPVVKTAYATDFGRLVVKDDAITFYESDGKTEVCTCAYEDRGAGTMSGEAAHKFELKADAPDACKGYHYLLTQPLMHHESGEEHLHIRYAGADAGGFDELMEGADTANWWPILTRSDGTTDAYVADYMLKFKGFYLSLLPEAGTVVFKANGEDFVRNGFVSEDGWRIDFSKVYVNVSSPTVYQTKPADRTSRHPGHDDDPGKGKGTETLNRATLDGDYFLNLKQDIFEVGRNLKAAPGTYTYLEFGIARAASSTEGFQEAYEGDSIVLAGSAVKNGQTVNFTVAFDEIMKFAACGPINAPLSADGEIGAEMTFHFDHIFGDAAEGPADPADENTVNYLAVGFSPFADLAKNGSLDIRQTDMISAGMPEEVYQQLISAVRTIGHTGEAHCDCIPTASRRFLTNHGIFLLKEGKSFGDPRNPKRIVMNTTAESESPTTISFYNDLNGETPLAEGCIYQYVGSKPDPHYFPKYKSSVWDLFHLKEGQPQVCQDYAHVSIRSPHDNPTHMHFRYGNADKGFDALLGMSSDPKSEFDPWWSSYQGISSDTPPASNFNFLNLNGTLAANDKTLEDPRNPGKLDMVTTTESESMTRLTFYANGDPGQVWASGDYQYMGSTPDPHYFPKYKSSVWDLFELQNGISGDTNAFRYVIFRSPHDSPKHAHMRYGANGFEALLNMSNDPESGFNPWWSTYTEPKKTGSLAAWRGSWRSHSAYMDSPEAEAAFETMAAKTERFTAEDVKATTKKAYRTDFGGMAFNGSSVTFYAQDGTTEVCTCAYESRGEGAVGEGTAHKFELKAGADDACSAYRYLLMWPPHSGEGAEHFHVRYSATDFDTLITDPANANWWPIMSRTEKTTTEGVVAGILQFTDFYLGLLPEAGTVVFKANGEDFVRDGFVSEDGWNIDFSKVYVNVSSPAVYQTQTVGPTARHPGHDDDPGNDKGGETFNRAALNSDYFLNLKQDIFEVGRNLKATPGTYTYLEFGIARAASSTEGFQEAYEGDSIVLAGSAVKDDRTVNFTIAFDEIMKFAACGPINAPLSADGEIGAEMTFHFDHIFGDAAEGPADPADENTVNYLAVGFSPFADLAKNGSLDIRQTDMISAGMPEAVYKQLISAVRTIGHTGEAHCDCIPTASRRFLTNHGIFLLKEGKSFGDPRNPKRIVMNTTAESESPTTISFYNDLNGEIPLAEGCIYQYAGSKPDPHYFPKYKSSVWDLFHLKEGQPQVCQDYAHVSIRSPHDNPTHMHFRYGNADKGFDALLGMSSDPKSEFDPWWSSYQGISSDTPPASNFNFLNLNGTLAANDKTLEDPRNPGKLDMLTTTESESMTRLTFYANGDPGQVWASGDYQYVGSTPDPHYFPKYKSSVWDMFELQNGISGDTDLFRYVIFRSPHSNPKHAHMRYGADGFEALLNMSNDPESGFDPWWSSYIEPESGR